MNWGSGKKRVSWKLPRYCLKFVGWSAEFNLVVTESEVGEISDPFSLEERQTLDGKVPNSKYCLWRDVLSFSRTLNSSPLLSTG